MPMRGILVALASAVLAGGCHDSTGITGHTDASTETTPGTCGNGIVETGEQCDDGDDDNCNGCSTECRWERAMSVGGGEHGMTVRVESVPCLPTPFTIEAWFRFDSTDTSCAIFHQLDCYTYTLAMDGDETSLGNKICDADGGCHAGISNLRMDLSPGTWHHLAVTYALDPEIDPGVYISKEYIDGTWLEGGWGTSPPGVWRCEGPLHIGAELFGHPDPLEATSCTITIDEVRISNDAVYLSDFTPPSRLTPRADTVALWDFDIGSGTTIPDRSGNGHDATLVDGSLVPDGCHLP